MLEVGNIIAHMDVQFLHIIPATDEISQRPELYYPSPKVPILPTTKGNSFA